MKKFSVKFRLQMRFVLIAAAALAVLQTVIVSFSIYRNYSQITRKADRIIGLIQSGSNSPEIGDARYFEVTYDIQSKKTETDLSHTSLVRRKKAAEYAKKVIAQKTLAGYEDGYRYAAIRQNGKIKITFLSRFMALEAFRGNCATLIIVSASGIAFMTAVLAAVSGKVVSPIVKNRQKQKEFITSASHELKTPLTVINADAQLLESEIGENEWLSDIMKQTSYMTEMTRKLVYLARAEEQSTGIVRIEFPVSDLASDICDSYRAVAIEKGKTLETDITPGLSYNGDQNAVRELMSVLADNAFKYCTDGGKIRVSLVREHKGVRFTVENAAQYIDKEQLSRLSDRFYRTGENSGIKDFGIGLSVANAVAQNHGGKLVIDMPRKDVFRATAILK